MSEIYQYISPNNILVLDDYSSTESNIHTIENVSFRVEKCVDFYNFYSPIAIKENKIINISNKQFSFLIYKYHHFVGSQLANQIVSTYNNLINDEKRYIDETVFQFMDYESIAGTGHAYDLIFYLLYIYKKFNLTCKLLVVNTTNKYYNTLLKLLSDYYNAEFLYIDTDKNYTFKNLICTRTYQNIFFNEVKEFINSTLITKILTKYNSFNFYKIVIKLKLTNKDNINRCNDSFHFTDKYINFIKQHNICDLNNIEDEDYKIYLLNKAENIITSCSSTYYINICYYLQNYSEKNINIVFHSHNTPDLWTFSTINNKIIQHMPGQFCGNITNQLYNNLSFDGNILSNINSIDEIVDNLIFICDKKL